jgi:hypothetical protein
MAPFRQILKYSLQTLRLFICFGHFVIVMDKRGFKRLNRRGFKFILQAITEFDAIHHAEGAPLIASFGDWRACQAQHGIVIERELFNGGGNSFGKAVLLLLAAFYAFNIDYGAISNTMYFIQYELMKIDGGKVPLKVKSLLRELAK